MKTKRKIQPVSVLLALLACIAASLGIVACGDYPVASVQSTSDSIATATGTGAPGGGGAPAALPANTAPLPCDVLEADGFPCVSAHSTVRRVVADYTGPLYQLLREDDDVTQEVGIVDGYADAATHDAFCATANCVIKILYDQSGLGHHLTEAPPGSIKPTPGNPVPSSDLPVLINGRSVYGMRFRPGQGYRSACNECPYPNPIPTGMAVGDEPQTMYMVSSQKDLINGCCFDYGNASRTANNDGNGSMEAVYLGKGVIWGTGVEGGPWVMADMENGLYPGWQNGSDRNISTATPLLYDFVTAVVVGDTADKNDGKGRFALYGGDTQAGVLKTMYDGIRPEKPGYVPMAKQGSVILSIGGDNSDGDGGRFYEGVVANGAAPIETVDELQAALVAAAYGK